MQTDNTRLWITEYALNCCSRNKAREAIRVPQPSMFSHPEIMPDFLTVEITNSPSYTDPFLCYFYPLDREKSQNRFSRRRGRAQRSDNFSQTSTDGKFAGMPNCSDLLSPTLPSR